MSDRPTLRIVPGTSEERFVAPESLQALRPDVVVDVDAPDHLDLQVARVHIESPVCVDALRAEGIRSIRFRAGGEAGLTGIGILVALEGAFTVVGGDGDELVQEGAGIALDRIAPWTFRCHSDLWLARASVPNELLSDQALRRSAYRCLPLEQSPLLESYAALLRSIVSDGNRRVQACRRLGRVVERFSTEVIEDAFEADLPDPVLGWRERIGRHIDQHLRDPDLSARTIGSALGISTRYVHKVFSTEETTVARAVEAQRLDGVAAALRSDDAPLAPAELAERFGFRSSDSLGRSFRRRFGLSVTEFRRDRGRYRL